MKKLIVLAAAALLTGCGTAIQAMNAYGGAAISSTQQVNDSYAKAWAVAGCGISIGAAYRNPEVIPALKALCMPGGDTAPSTLLNPSTRAGRE